MQRPNNLKVGDQFRVIEENSEFDLGEIITLESDDGSNYPFFWKKDKSDFWSIFFSDLEPVAKTVRDAQVGDVVVGKTNGSEYMVLERWQNTVKFSQRNNFKKSLGNYHFDELEKNYTLKDAPEVVDDKTILTMNEIAEKFGIEVSTLKIAKD